MPERSMPRGANVTGLRRGKILETDEAGPFVYDVDAEGRVLGIEILHASKMLAPGD
ncbi:DUF2283 domain-containing protein [Chelativorans sp. ZYF759]|uniref:DUF2283 domain-containing protein n=1 Tax=Chelativorans sp. ZYF759 TaxID=2692213 RepID=UPI00145CBAB3|nr:DUF2283 domain-containing protein [Chelativorans sp. ZYF759]NMG41940.1 DUF2283 domain-containing protein [Chelativorans sp. ZYF759]